MKTKVRTISAMLLSALVLLTACKSEFEGYQVKGTIQNVENGFAVLEIVEPESATISDTAVIKNGQFEFKGNVSEALHAKITINSENKQSGFLSFILENADININLDYSNLKEQYRNFYFTDVKVEGGKNNSLSKEYSELYAKVKDQEKYSAYNKSLEEINKLQEEDRELYMSEMDNYRIEYKDVTKEIQDEYNKRSLSLIMANTDIEYAGSIMSMQARNMDLEKMDELFNSFTPNVQNSYFSKKIKEKIDNLKAMQPGNPAPDFTLKTPQNESFSLSSLKGKYVLVDFWASWCQPCRAAVPELKSFYEEYKDKGFEIVGIANDSKREDWIRAIEEDQTPWIHVIDEFPIKNSTAKTSTQYAIPYLPSYFLVDTDGKLIGRMDKEEVFAKVKKLLQD